MSTSQHMVPRTQPRCSPSRRGKPIPHHRSKSHRLPSRPDSTCPPSGYCTAIMSQSAPDQTVPGPPQYHTTLAYHHDKKTPTHLLIACLTTRAYHHARGTLGTQVLLSITLPSRPGEPVPDADHPSRRRVICISM